VRRFLQRLHGGSLGHVSTVRQASGNRTSSATGHPPRQTPLTHVNARQRLDLAFIVMPTLPACSRCIEKASPRRSA
jgi:hypothetical protein